MEFRTKQPSVSTELKAERSTRADKSRRLQVSEGKYTGKKGDLTEMEKLKKH